MRNSDMDPELFATIQALWRAKGEPSTRTIARAAGCSHTTVHQILKGIPHRSHWLLIKKVAEALGATEDEVKRLFELWSNTAPSRREPRRLTLEERMASVEERMVEIEEMLEARLPATMFRTVDFDDGDDGQLRKVHFVPVDEGKEDEWYGD